MLIHPILRRFLISCIFGFFFIFIIFIVVDLKTIFDSVLSLSFKTVLIIFFIYICSLLLRSLRFWLLVNGVKGNFKISTSIGVTFSSYFLSIFLPARIGDGIKLFRAKKKYDVPYTSTGLAVIIEKVLDILCISSIVIVSIIVIILTQNVILSNEALFLLQTVLIIEILGFFILIMISIYGEHFIPFFNRMGNIGEFLILIYKNYKEALNTFIQKYTLLILTPLITIMIWLIDAICLYLVISDLVYVFDQNLILITILSALFGFLTFIFPISPGNIGSYELAVSIMFIVFFPSFLDIIISAALIEHALKMFIHLVFGGPPTIYYSDFVLDSLK